MKLWKSTDNLRPPQELNKISIDKFVLCAQCHTDDLLRMRMENWARVIEIVIYEPHPVVVVYYALAEHQLTIPWKL
jgi:hypothetical protein